MADLKDDIEKYLSGQLGPAEMHALEKKALSDPFLAEALEGAHAVGAGNFLKDIRELDQRVEGKRKARSAFPNAWRIAASVTLIAVASYILFIFLQPAKTENLAEKTSPALPLDSALSDSVAAESKTPSSKVEPGDKLLSLNKPVNPAPKKAVGELREESKPTPLPAATSAPEIEVNREETSSGEAARQAPALDQAKADDLVETESREKVAVADEDQSVRKKKDTSGPKKARATSALGFSGRRQQQVVTGKITDAGNGDPIPGANVLVQGTAEGVVTDVNGNFHLVTDTSSDHLVVSFIGYETKEVAIPTGQSQVNVELPADAAQLSEVVVTGYGVDGREPTRDEPTELAEPVDGRRTYNQYLQSNLRYPQQAVEKRIEGKVTLEFTVQPNGTLSDFSVIRGLEGGCNDEVIRLVREGPRWKPSAKASIPVKSTVRVRVRFKLP